MTVLRLPPATFVVVICAAVAGDWVKGPVLSVDENERTERDSKETNLLLN